MREYRYTLKELQEPKETVLRLIQAIKEDSQLNIFEDLRNLHPVFIHLGRRRWFPDDSIFTKKDFEKIREVIKDLYDKAHKELISVSELDELYALMHQTELKRVLPSRRAPPSRGL